MRKLPLTVLVLIFIVGCLTTPSLAFERGNKEILDPNKTSRLVVGKTTKAEVRAMFGEPMNFTVRTDGWEKWVYRYVDVKMFSARNSEAQGLGLIFDNKGILQQKAIAR
jgi:outer membrane protein assembly factor BamE (lipoprotein component of BamABCDE complex)